MPSIKILQSLNIAGTISANSITVNTVSALSSVNIPHGGDITGNLKINGDLTVNHLTALSGSTFVNTTFTTTSSLCVNSIMNLGPSFYVGANGTGDIASFYDTDTNVEVLHIGGANGSFPNVGIKVSDPTKTLTVSGEISASGDVWFGSKINMDSVILSATSGVFTVLSSLSTPSISADTGIFNISISAANLSGDHYGSGANLSGVLKPIMNVQSFSADGVWTKPSNPKLVKVQLWSGAGGGGSGRKGAAGTVRCGGGGGGGGGYYEALIDANALSSTEIITVGVGGNGGASQTNNSTNGINGSGGTSSSIGTLIVVPGSVGGTGGTNTAGSGGGGSINGNVGASASTSGGVGVNGTPSGTGSTATLGSGSGASGGGITSSDAASAGATGGRYNLLAYGGGSAGTINNNGGNGISITTINTSSLPIGASGGGSGGGSTTTNAGSGGAGGFPAGGGGGGGAALDGVGNSGAGGKGGNGLVILTTYF